MHDILHTYHVDTIQSLPLLPCSLNICSAVFFLPTLRTLKQSSPWLLSRSRLGESQQRIQFVIRRNISKGWNAIAVPQTPFVFWGELQYGAPLLAANNVVSRVLKNQDRLAKLVSSMFTFCAGKIESTMLHNITHFNVKWI